MSNIRKPHISVLMAVHNCVKCLPEAVESILNQKFQDFEFIIIDDGSTELLRKYVKIHSRICFVI